MAIEKLRPAESEKEAYEGDIDCAPPPSPPPSSATSPTNDFSFIALSLQPPPPSGPHHCTTTQTVLNLPSAGDIYFLGHTLPPPKSADAIVTRHLTHTRSNRSLKCHLDALHSESKESSKRKSAFSFLFRHRKSSRIKKPACHCGEKEGEEDCARKSKKTAAFDVSWIVKKCASVVESIFGEDSKHDHLLRLPYRSWKRRDGWWKKKGQLSAPASIKASPSNSGRFSTAWPVVTSGYGAAAEELGIQAAIAHCKSSNASGKEDKCNCCHKKQ